MHRAVAIPTRPFGRLRWNQDYVDLAVAVLLAAASLISVHQDFHRLDPISAPLIVLQTLPIAWRRRGPMRVLYVTGSSITLYSLLGYPETFGYLGVFSAFYTVAAYETRRRATIAAAVTAAGVLISFIGYAAFQTVSNLPVNLLAAYLAYGLAWVLGDNLRVRRAYTAQLEERAARLEQEREEKAVAAVAQERGRIARELHDVVAHHVSVMVVQAAGARRVVDKDPALARDALAAVEEAGRTALAEMRRMLEVLRDDEAGVGPQPGLCDLERLVGQVREAGLPVEIAIEGDERLLPAGMDLAAYRIIQEALTNAVKHAGKATARVSVCYEPEALEIEVLDDGRGAAAPLLEGIVEGGHGLIGMRERVALYGGELETGPVFPGGYRVHARFPLEPVAPGSRASCCEEESALSAVAALAERDRERAERATRDRRAAGLTAEHPAGHGAEPASGPRPGLVKPRVVPPLIGRVVPPAPRPAEPRPTRHTQGQRPHRDGSPSD
jgi:signal transduction histidine kinase